MNELDIALGVVIVLVALMPGALVGSLVGSIVPRKLIGFPVCLAAIAIIAKLIASHFEFEIFMIAAPLAFWALPIYFLVSGGRAANDAQ